jgi:alanine-glyoxylate transaminase/serine-glyoxylate transaminase/serine-pyruvate transaminase
LPQLTSVRLPDGRDEAALRSTLLTEYGIEVGGGLGEFAGTAWRIGLMGHSARERSVTTLLGALYEQG